MYGRRRGEDIKLGERKRERERVQERKIQEEKIKKKEEETVRNFRERECRRKR